MKINLNSIERRSPEAAALARSLGKASDKGWEISPEDFKQVQALFVETQSASVPAPQWPAWATELAKQRLPEDRGIGDTVEHVYGPMGTEGFLAWYRGQFGKRPCPKCPALWNRRYPYAGPESVSTP